MTASWPCVAGSIEAQISGVLAAAALRLGTHGRAIRVNLRCWAGALTGARDAQQSLCPIRVAINLPRNPRKTCPMRFNVHLSQVLEASRHLAESDAPWDALLQSALQFIGGDSATLIVFDPAGALIAARQHGVDPQAEREYVQYFHAHDIAVSHTRHAVQGSWFDTARMAVDGSQAGARAYLDYMQRFRMRQMVGLVAIRAPELHGGLTIQRSTVQPTAARDGLRPEMQRFSGAVQAGLNALHRRRQDWIGHAEATLDSFAEALCIVSAQGRVLHASPSAAARLASGGCGLRLREGALWHPDRRAHERLTQALQRASAQRLPTSLPLRDAAGLLWGHADLASAPVWTGMAGQSPVLLRLRAALLPDPAALQERLAAAFALTPSEARVLAALALGQSVAEHARHHGSSVRTVRTQVSRLMEKLDSTRQADLVRKALQVAG